MQTLNIIQNTNQSKWFNVWDIKCSFDVTNQDVDDLKRRIVAFKKDVKEVMPGARFRVRGRGPRKFAFSQTGRSYCSGWGNKNDVGIGQPESKYMNSFVVYVYR